MVEVDFNGRFHIFPIVADGFDRRMLGYVAKTKASLPGAHSDVYNSFSGLEDRAISADFRRTG
jgi:hypothetical protein